LKLLCELATCAFPELQSASTQYSPSRVLHFFAPLRKSRPVAVSGHALYGEVVRRLQGGPDISPANLVVMPDPKRARPWYFNK
jgi:hypothetical protein